MATTNPPATANGSSAPANPTTATAAATTTTTTSDTKPALEPALPIATETEKEKTSSAVPSRASLQADNDDVVNPPDFQGEVLSNNELPSPETIRRIGDYIVLDRHGKTHTFKSLYTGRNVARRVLIIFVRHFFCGVSFNPSYSSGVPCTWIHPFATTILAIQKRANKWGELSFRTAKNTSATCQPPSTPKPYCTSPLAPSSRSLAAATRRSSTCTRPRRTARTQSTPTRRGSYIRNWAWSRRWRSVRGPRT